MTPRHHATPHALRIRLVRLLTAGCLGLVPLLVVPTVAAAPMYWAGGGIGEDGAARAAAAHSGGKVLSVRSSDAGGRIIYEVTVLRGDGQVVVLRVDGQSGAVIGG